MSDQAFSAQSHKAHPQWQVLPGGAPERHAGLGKTVWAIVLTAVALRLGLTLGLGKGILSEATYGAMQQFRPLFDAGAAGIAEGLTSTDLTPFGVLIGGIHHSLGLGAPALILALNIVFFAIGVLALIQPQRPSVRTPLALILCFAPAFLQVGMQGADVEWIFFCLATSYAFATRGKASLSAAFWTVAFLTNPACLLFGPVWIAVLSRSPISLKAASWKSVLAPVGTTLAIIGLWSWTLFQLEGSHWITQLAHWWTAGEAPLLAADSLWLGLPAATFFPAIGAGGFLPSAAATVCLAALCLTLYVNFKAGTRESWAWLATCGLWLICGLGSSFPWATHSAILLPTLAWTMASVPAILHFVPRFHRRKLVPIFAAGLLAIGLPSVIQQASAKTSVLTEWRSAAAALAQVASDSETDTGPVLTQRAGLFGFLHPGQVISAQGEGEQEFVPLYNQPSLAGMAQGLEAKWILVSESQLIANRVAGLGTIWTDEADQSWWNVQTERHSKHGEWHLYRVTGPMGQHP